MLRILTCRNLLVCVQNILNIEIRQTLLMDCQLAKQRRRSITDPRGSICSQGSSFTRAATLTELGGREDGQHTRLQNLHHAGIVFPATTELFIRDNTGVVTIRSGAGAESKSFSVLVPQLPSQKTCYGCTRLLEDSNCEDCG